jgi:hypothetical protein
MGKLGTSMHHVTLYTPCIALVVLTYTCIFAIYHVEHRLEEPPTPAPVEAGEHE